MSSRIASCKTHLTPSPSHRRLDVLVVAEQILGVVLLLELRQPLIVRAVGRPDLFYALVALLPDVVDIDATSDVGPQGLPQVSGPADVDCRLPRIQPLGEEEQVIQVSLSRLNYQ
jgi:hypothetical protein